MIRPDVVRSGDRIREITQRHDSLKADLERLYQHWEEAAELNG